MNLFNLGQSKRLKYNKFDLSHEKKMSVDFADLIPIYLEEVIPGDKFRVNSEIFLRMSPLVSPVMHRIDVYTHYFFVPNRLVHENWQDFITGGEDGEDTTVLPYIDMFGNEPWFDKGQLSDYMGIPTVDQEETIADNDYQINAIPFRAYQLIYNEYYRDQDLTPEVVINKTDGQLSSQETSAVLEIRRRAYEKDYFTSARPWLQKGEEVQINAEVEYSRPAIISNPEFGTPYDPDTLSHKSSVSGGQINSFEAGEVSIENLDNVNIGTVNNLRTAIKIQEWLEKNARAGSRYIESILAHFGVKSSDGRLQRPQYLGGGKQPVVISEVLNHTGTQDAPQGAMAGHGISVGSTNSFQHSFEEHGFIIGIMSIMPKPAYMQGLHRLWTRNDKFDYYWPEFANVGEQAVLSKEIYFDPLIATAHNDTTFGYQARYAEYKSAQSSVHGEFRDTLSFWHLSRIFSARPELNNAFLQLDEDEQNRIFAVTTGESNKMYVQIFNRVSALRKMPVFGIPSF